MPTHPTTVADVQGLATIPVHSATAPNYAGLLGIGRSRAYRDVTAGTVAVRRSGRALRVLVEPLLESLGATR